MRVIELRVNGVVHRIDVSGETPLLWVLRDHLALTGTKFGCGIGVCGSCTVHLDGRAARACSVTVAAAAASEITTIEGLSPDGFHPVQRAWLAHQVPQCGYCQPGFVMAVAALLDANPDPSDAEIGAAITNLCRCGTYPRIRRAIASAVRARLSGAVARADVAPR